MKTKHSATILAILAAALYAINIPLSKLLLQNVAPTMMAAFLYLGAGLGLWLLGTVTEEKENSEPLTRPSCPIPSAWWCWTLPRRSC
jgi:drug/metabolite transporter (DMT)-like permease